jgi:membrane-anchored protein YejM (alkaline phosphatase superfamily)
MSHPHLWFPLQNPAPFAFSALVFYYSSSIDISVFSVVQSFLCALCVLCVSAVFSASNFHLPSFIRSFVLSANEYELTNLPTDY